MNKNEYALNLLASAGLDFEVVYQGEDSVCPVCRTILGMTPRAA